MNGSESCDLLQAGPVPTEGQATGCRIPLRSLVSQEGSPGLQLLWEPPRGQSVPGPESWPRTLALLIDPGLNPVTGNLLSPVPCSPEKGESPRCHLPPQSSRAKPRSKATVAAVGEEEELNHVVRSFVYVIIYPLGNLPGRLYD